MFPILSHFYLSFSISLYYCLFHLFSLKSLFQPIKSILWSTNSLWPTIWGKMLQISLLNITFLDNHVHSYPAFVPKMHRLLRWFSFCSEILVSVCRFWPATISVQRLAVLSCGSTDWVLFPSTGACDLCWGKDPVLQSSVNAVSESIDGEKKEIVNAACTEFLHLKWFC